MYTEICQPGFGGSSVFCHDTGQVTGTYDQQRGPFFIYASDSSNIGSIPNLSISRGELYRCIDTSTGYHFLSNTNNCENILNSKMEYLLGYVALKPSSAMPRQILRCKNIQFNYYYHVLDDYCLSNDQPSKILGYAS